jgi:hypothetical protein
VPSNITRLSRMAWHEIYTPVSAKRPANSWTFCLIARGLNPYYGASGCESCGLFCPDPEDAPF